MLVRQHRSSGTRTSRINPACQFSLILRLQEQLGLLLTLFSSESKSAHKDVYFFPSAQLSGCYFCCAV